MWLSDISIKRPVLATVLSLILVLLGIVGLTRLSVREYPDIDPPVVSVNTIYPGASPQVMETTVTEPLEDELIGIEGIKTMSSISREESSSIIIEFELSRDINVAAQDVRDRVSRARRNLPNDIEEPIISKQDTDASAIMWLGLSGKGYSPLQITDYADRYIVDQLQTVSGVGNIIIGGAREYSMRIWLDPAKLAARRITVQDVEETLRNENIDIPSGRIEGIHREFTIRTLGELKTPDEFNSLIIKHVNGNPVYLQDIGKAEIGPRSYRSLVRFNGEPAVGLGIVKQSKANTLDVAKGVREKVDQIRKTLPPGLSIEAAYDSSVFIQHSVDEVVESLFVAFVLVVLVIFMFLRSKRATLIPSLSIPISLISTFTIMYFLGYTINVITLLALTLAIGLVVDDSIIVLENIYRRMEDGEPPLVAAKNGMEEIGFAILATTASLVAVFIPIVFIEGIMGRLLVEFAVVMSFAIIVSGFVSLSLSPMMCSRILKTERAQQNRPASLQPKANILDRFSLLLQNMGQWYQSSLIASFNLKPLIVLALLVLGVFSAAAYYFIPKEFLPLDDRGSIMTIIQAPEGATLDYTDKAVRKAEAVYNTVPEVARQFSIIAMSAQGVGQVNSGMMFVNLVPARERKRKQQDIVASLFPQMMAIPEAFVFPINPPSNPVSRFGKPVEMALQGTDIDELDAVANRIIQRAHGITGLYQLESDLKLNKPQLEVEINRNKASTLGVSARDIARSMQILLGGLDLSTFKLNNKRYDVMVQAFPQSRLVPSQLENISVEGSENMLIPLSSLVTYRETVSPKELNHYNRLRAATISGNIMPIPGISLGNILDELEAIAHEEMGPGMSIDWKGDAREYKETGGATWFAFLLALLVVYLVLAAQFESYTDPFIVMLTVPLALCGALLTLAALTYLPMFLAMLPAIGSFIPQMNYTLNIYSQIGLILLIGLVTKNGILIVEFANQFRERFPGMTAREAVIKAAQIRLRPILMTSIATIMGAVPIAIGLGAGIDGRKALGMVIIGGVAFSTLLTLFIIPLAYELIKKRKATTDEPVPELLGQK